jgi:tryptophan-rich sensory protein
MTAAAATIGAAVAGNSSVGKEDLNWLKGLRGPRWQLSLPAFGVVGGLYYLVMSVVLYRSTDRRDKLATRLAVVVLVLNELWNVLFFGRLFGRRSAARGFFGVLAFLLPLGGLQVAVRKDRTSAVVLAPYTAWVIFYDLPWTYRLWRLNRST